jgi:hypothetical protein
MRALKAATLAGGGGACGVETVATTPAKLGAEKGLVIGETGEAITTLKFGLF